MATKRRLKVRLSIYNHLRDYKGFGKLTNGMLRDEFCVLSQGQVVSYNELERAIRG
ncbi:hypothetical protein [Kordia sp.]|uniref:hypothetical protein n=1 Tax=Kordia sp. TaxID=1965332 RepID=UPI003D2B8B11